MKVRVCGLAVLLAFGFSTSGRAQDAGSTKPSDPTASGSSLTTIPSTGTGTSTTAKGKTTRPRFERATFAGGCFWSLEAVFEHIRGVTGVVSGYAGGNVSNPSYEMVGTGATGHAESITIEYDTTLLSYEDLLKMFFKAHDPTTLNAQGDDFGPNYRSMIFFHSEEQRQAALKMYRELTNAKVFRSPIVTELVPFTTFWPAESYHQDYYANHRGSLYTSIYIDPKLKKLKLVASGKSNAKTTKKAK